MPNRVLFTGHGGFVGHHCLKYFLDNTDWELVCIDSFRHKGTVRRVVESISDNKRVKTYKHDLSVPIDPQLDSLIVNARLDPDSFAVSREPIDFIINMASESAVERSTLDPVSCLRNNYELMINMLEYARKCQGLKLFLHISTDEVYGEAPERGGHKEWATIMPSNPYAASKAAQEALAIAYWRTYNLPIVIVNIMNIIGERQDPEKFLPKIIQKVAKGEEMPIYGDSPDKIGSRVYIHAHNVASALVHLSYMKPKTYRNALKMYQNRDCLPPWGNPNDYEVIDADYVRPDRFNICGDTELNNLELAQMVAGIMGKELKYKLVPSESARPGYDRRYMLDGSKLHYAGWRPPLSFKQSLERIVNWTLKNPHWLV
jgi:dTDP-glucose 4,6-dehydratase